MTIRGIYNADGITTYTVADQRNIHSKSFNGKIIYGDTALVVSAQSTPNMTIKVSSGECSINGAILQNTASTNLTITSNTASYARIDAIVAYINGTTYDLRVLKGTAAATPSAPDCSSNMYVKLAEVYVGVGVSSIQNANITDTRSTNNQYIIESLSSLVVDIAKNKVLESDGVGTGRGYKLYADGECRAWNSGIQTISGNALSITVPLNYTFKNQSSCLVVARFIDVNRIPYVLATKWESNNSLMIYYPSNKTPQIANGAGEWNVHVIGY